jgi:hypothetical protein
MADSDSCHHLLRGRVGDDATRLDTFQQNTHLVTPRICSWSWCTSMVSGIHLVRIYEGVLTFYR